MFPSQNNHISQGLNYRSNVNSFKKNEIHTDNNLSSVGSLIEGFENSDPISEESNRLIQRLSDLEANFNETLNKYTEIYQQVLNSQLQSGQMLTTNNNLNVNVVNTDGSYFYVNSYGKPMKYSTPTSLGAATPTDSKEGYEKRHGTCPTAIKLNGTTGTDDEQNAISEILGGADGTVYLAHGVPCNIIGKNIKDNETGEVYFITDNGLKRKFIDFDNSQHENCSRSIAFNLDTEIVRLIPSGTDIINSDADEGCKLSLDNVNDLDRAISYNRSLETIAQSMLDESTKINSTDGTFRSEIDKKRAEVAARIPTLQAERMKFMNLKRSIDSSRATINEMKSNNTTNFIMYLSLIVLIIVCSAILYLKGAEPTITAIFYLCVAVLVLFIMMEGIDGTREKAKLVVSKYV